MVWTSLTRVTKKWLETGGYWNKVQDSTKAPRTGPRSFSDSDHAVELTASLRYCDSDTAILRSVIHVIMKLDFWSGCFEDF